MVVVIWLEAIVDVACLDVVAVISFVDVEVIVVDTEIEVEADDAVDMTVPGPRSKTRVEFLQHELSDPQQK